MAKTKKTHLLETDIEQEILGMQKTENESEETDIQDSVNVLANNPNQQSFILIQDMGYPFGKKGDIVTYDTGFKDIKQDDFYELVKESIRLKYIKIYEQY
jgi:hypothetical protein